MVWKSKERLQINHFSFHSEKSRLSIVLLLCDINLWPAFSIVNLFWYLSKNLIKSFESLWNFFRTKRARKRTSKLSITQEMGLRLNRGRPISCFQFSIERLKDGSENVLLHKYPQELWTYHFIKRSLKERFHQYFRNFFFKITE